MTNYSQFTSPTLGVTAIKYEDNEQVILGFSNHMAGFTPEELLNELEPLLGWVKTFTTKE